MSTARTTIGCLAEDYTEEIAWILHEWARTTRAKYLAEGWTVDPVMQRRLDIADSFVLNAF